MRVFSLTFYFVFVKIFNPGCLADGTIAGIEDTNNPGNSLKTNKKQPADTPAATVSTVTDSPLFPSAAGKK